MKAMGNSIGPVNTGRSVHAMPGNCESFLGRVFYGMGKWSGNNLCCMRTDYKIILE
jgi:hypothetical protein